MRKINKNIENPLDNFFIYLADKSSDYYKQLNFTPNILTSISLFFGMFSCYLLYKNYNVLAALCWLIAYYYDCADGFFARKYNMVSQFGDLYDHIADITKFLCITLVIYYTHKDKIFFWLPFFLILILFLTIHIGCQEQIYNKTEESVTISKLTIVCPDKNMIHYTKYVGLGTFILAVTYVILTIND